VNTSSPIRILSPFLSRLFEGPPAHTGAPGVKVTTSGFNSRADYESKMSDTHGSNSQRFRSYEFLMYSNFFLLWRCDPTSFLRFLDHTQRRTTVGRTPLDE